MNKYYYVPTGLKNIFFILTSTDMLSRRNRHYGTGGCLKRIFI